MGIVFRSRLLDGCRFQVASVGWVLFLGRVCWMCVVCRSRLLDVCNVLGRVYWMCIVFRSRLLGVCSF